MLKGSLAAFVRVTFALSWGVGGAYLLARAMWPSLPPLDAANPVFLVINCAPSAAAFILVVRAGGPAGARALAMQTFRGFRFGAFLVAFATLPLLACLLSAGAFALGLAWPVSIRDAFLGIPLLLFTTPLLLSNFAPIGEEYGWRGFALPLLLQRHSPFAASMLLGALWIVWHLPAFLLGGIVAAALASFFWWAVATLALSLCMTALYTRGGGNLLIAGIMPHAMINAFGSQGLWLNRPAEALALSACAIAAWLTTRREKGWSAQSL
jgi:uncharacterized protein